jgi:hypothetical protein
MHLTGGAIKTAPYLAVTRYGGSTITIVRQLDLRYRKKYGMSMIENLEAIRQHGIRKFIKSEKERWTCSECGGVICVHRGFCSTCGAKKE